MNLQDAFLNQVRVQRVPVTIYLMGGQQLKGIVCGFDAFIILLDCAGKQNLIYKHAVVSVLPQKPMNLFRTQEEAPGANSGEEGLGQP